MNGPMEIGIRFPVHLALATALVSCARPEGTAPSRPESDAPSGATEAVATSAAPPAGWEADSARGGRYFDRWWRYDPTFEVDDPTTHAPDGAGGPHGDGTLSVAGTSRRNPGHDYRLVHYFGWDLRGTHGIHGPAYQGRPHVADVDLLADERDVNALRRWLAVGDDTIPAFGEVLDPGALADIAAFIVETREGTLPHPDEIFTLSQGTPNGYVLNEGADVEAGHALVAKMCSGGFCHGVGGNAIALEDSHSLGSYARTRAHVAWFKIVNGHPGTAMGRQTTDASEVLDILAALCDRSVYPPEVAEVDVPHDDPRCGDYLVPPSGKTGKK